MVVYEKYLIEDKKLNYKGWIISIDDDGYCSYRKKGTKGMIDLFSAKNLRQAKEDIDTWENE